MLLEQNNRSNIDRIPAPRNSFCLHVRTAQQTDFSSSDAVHDAAGSSIPPPDLLHSTVTSLPFGAVVEESERDQLDD